MPFAERVFLTSYAKLARCYDPATGIWSGLSLATGQSITITSGDTWDRGLA